MASTSPTCTAAECHAWGVVLEQETLKGFTAQDLSVFSTRCACICRPFGRHPTHFPKRHPLAFFIFIFLFVFLGDWLLWRSPAAPRREQICKSSSAPPRPLRQRVLLRPSSGLRASRRYVCLCVCVCLLLCFMCAQAVYVASAGGLFFCVASRCSTT